MTSYKTKTIKEVTGTLIDYRGKTPRKTVSGIKLITAKVIKGGAILDGKHEFISEDDYDAWMRRGLPKQWDILVTTEAPLGEVAQLRTSERIALAQRVILLRGDPDIIDQNYYFQALKSSFVQAELKSRSSGTTVSGVKQSELLQVKIPYHPLSNQTKIASILSAYDDLIENNTRRIKILEEMAKTIYEEWFVKFRFPGIKFRRATLEEKEITGRNDFPNRWKLCRYSDLVESYLGGGWGSEEPTEQDQCKVAIIRGADFVNVRSGAALETPNRYIKDASLEKRRLISGDILIENSVNAYSRCVGSSLLITEGILKRVGYSSICASFCKNFRLKNPSLAPIAYLHIKWLYEKGKMAFYQHIATNGIGNFQAKRFVDSEAIPLPEDNALLADICERLSQLTVSTYADQIDNLRLTRDLLLPKLISGEIDVENLDIQTGGFDEPDI